MNELHVDPERHACTWMGKSVALTVTEFFFCNCSRAAQEW